MGSVGPLRGQTVCQLAMWGIEWGWGNTIAFGNVYKLDKGEEYKFQLWTTSEVIKQTFVYFRMLNFKCIWSLYVLYLH